MPPKAKITRDMIVEAGLAVVREKGQEQLNARSVAGKLGCSTQPVMYHFTAMEELKSAVHARADEIHTAFLMEPSEGNPMLAIGLRYIRFAAEEGNLFRFLFQSDRLSGGGLQGMLDSDALAPMIAVLCRESGLAEGDARRVFAVLFTCVHGIAAMLANNSMEYDEDYCASLLQDVFYASVGYYGEKTKNGEAL